MLKVHLIGLISAHANKFGLKLVASEDQANLVDYFRGQRKRIKQ